MIGDWRKGQLVVSVALVGRGFPNDLKLSAKGKDVVPQLRELRLFAADLSDVASADLQTSW